VSFCRRASAAAVATAALVQAAESGIVSAQSHIVLNLTGGGYKRVKEDYTLYQIRPATVVSMTEPDTSLISQLKEWVSQYG
jgi:cysteate synthase